MCIVSQNFVGVFFKHVGVAQHILLNVLLKMILSKKAFVKFARSRALMSSWSDCIEHEQSTDVNAFFDINKKNKGGFRSPTGHPTQH